MSFNEKKRNLDSPVKLSSMYVNNLFVPFGSLKMDIIYKRKRVRKRDRKETKKKKLTSLPNGFP